MSNENQQSQESIYDYKERYLDEVNNLITQNPIQNKRAQEYFRVNLQRVIEGQSSDQQEQVISIHDKTMDKYSLDEKYNITLSYEDKLKTTKVASELVKWLIDNKRAQKENFSQATQENNDSTSDKDDLKERYAAMKEKQRKESQGRDLKFEYTVGGDPEFNKSIKDFLATNKELAIEIEDFSIKSAEQYMQLVNGRLEYKGINHRMKIEESASSLAKLTIIEMAQRYENGDREFIFDSRRELIKNVNIEVSSCEAVYG